MSLKHHASRALTASLAAAALAAPSALAQDLSSPDARDAATHATLEQDLRSPDARAAATHATLEQDLRSPDARAAATAQAPKRADVFTGGVRALDLLEPYGRDATAAVPPTTRPPDAPTVVEVRPARGFDWTSAGIGAGGTIALVVIALAGAATVAGRSRPAAH